jgi:hypothetical protein
MVDGREFDAIDGMSAQPVAIVNEKLARDFWPGVPALGKRLRVPGESQMRVVIGVARNANYSTWGEAPQRCVYVPMEQNLLPAMTLYVRSPGNPAHVVDAVLRQIAAVDPRVLVTAVRTGRDIIDGSLFQARLGVALLAALGILGLVLASMGLYGILAYAVNQRHREIGLRMALGASRGSVLRLIVKQGMALVAAGVAIGWLGSLAAGRLLRAMLYGVAPGDPVSVLAAAALLCSVALAACCVPARWATHIDPLQALRQG